MRSVTLEVTPEEAQKLVLAQDTGTLHLALRSEKDETTAAVTAVSVRELHGTAYPAPITAAKTDGDEEAAPALPSQIAVRTLRGAMRSTMVMRATPGQGSVYIDGDNVDGAAVQPLQPTTASAP